jgi:hypothetical protein
LWISPKSKITRRALQHLDAAAYARDAQQQLRIGVAEREARELVLDTHEVTVAELLQDQLTGLVAHSK